MARGRRRPGSSNDTTRACTAGAWQTGVSVDDLRQPAIAAGLDPDQVVVEAEALGGLVSDSGS